MAVEPHSSRRQDGKRAARRLGAKIAALAGAQYGVVARRQLRGLGASNDQIDDAIAPETLDSVHRAVFAAGHRLLTVEGRWMAGVLAGGDGAVLSHDAGADHWGVTGLRRPLAHVTAPTRRRSRPGLRFHQLRVPDDERTVHEGIPVTTVARTLLDYAGTASPARIRQALAIAEARRLGDETSLADLIDRYPHRPGIAVLRNALSSAFGERGVAASELELRFDEFIDERDLPPPEKNALVRAGGRVLRVDCLWPSAGLVVELDSRSHHGDWEAAEVDRQRDLALLAIGLRTARVTSRRLDREPDQLEAELVAALAAHVHRP